MKKVQIAVVFSEESDVFVSQIIECERCGCHTWESENHESKNYDHLPTQEELEADGYEGEQLVCQMLGLPVPNGDGTCSGCDHLPLTMSKEEIVAQLIAEEEYERRKDEMYMDWDEMEAYTEANAYEENKHELVEEQSPLGCLGDLLAI